MALPSRSLYTSRTTSTARSALSAQNGEPLGIEEWVNGRLHGKSTYFKNGNRYVEIAYLYGHKNGIERHFIDGDIVSQEIAWETDQKHGESIFYADGKPESQWYYAGERVSKHKFDDLNRLDEIISRLPYREEDYKR